MEITLPEGRNDESLIVVDADQFAVAKSCIQKINGAIAHVWDGLKANNLRSSERYNCLGASKGYLKQLNDLLGGKDDGKSELDNAYANLRSAYEEIARLQKAMAENANVENMSFQLGVMDKTVKNWWKSLGFYYSKGHFFPLWNGANYNAVLTGHLDQHGDEEQPVTGKGRKIQTIKELAQHADIIHNNGEYHLVASQRSIDYIRHQLRSRFPGTDVRHISTKSIGRTDQFGIWEIEAHIPIVSIGDDDIGE